MAGSLFVEDLKMEALRNASTAPEGPPSASEIAYSGLNLT
jgi:hypothetical protein